MSFARSCLLMRAVFAITNMKPSHITKRSVRNLLDIDSLPGWAYRSRACSLTLARRLPNLIGYTTKTITQTTWKIRLGTHPSGGRTFNASGKFKAVPHITTCLQKEEVGGGNPPIS
jgi:hypothetical protein